MANFTPLKNRFLLELDRSLLPIKSAGHFLDFGCGRADVAAHMLSKKGWTGDLLEVDDRSREMVANDERFNDCKLYAKSDELQDDYYDLILMFDVLEHLPHPEKVLAGIYKKLKPGGALALIIPYRESTWGWDDDHYGHLRRWSAAETIEALEKESFVLLQLSDPTFPVYSFLRWVMLCRQKKPVAEMYEGGSVEETMLKRSEMSPHNNAWKSPPKLVDYLPWDLINKMTLPFNKIMRGDEVFALAIKKKIDVICEHCGVGQYTYLEDSDGYVLSRCRHCSNRRLWPSGE